MWRLFGECQGWRETAVELVSTFAGLDREGKLSADDYIFARRHLATVESRWLTVEPNSRAIELARSFPQQYGLRALDSLQLASALIWCSEYPKRRISFPQMLVCFRRPRRLDSPCMTFLNVRRANVLTLLGLILVFAGCGRENPAVRQTYPQTSYVSREGEVDGRKFRYRVYVPPKLNLGERVPAMLYLHGAGNRGDDNESQLNGLASVIEQNRDNFNFLIVIPQCPADRFWDEKLIGQAVKALDDTVVEFSADSNRLYLAGFSLGGLGVWNTAAMFPDKFAALVPMSARVLPRATEVKDVAPIIAELAGSKTPYKAFAERLGTPAIWIFHGSEDNVVAVDNSRRIAEAFKTIGSTRVRYSEVANAGHEPLGFSEPELFDWLGKQRLSTP